MSTMLCKSGCFRETPKTSSMVATSHRKCHAVVTATQEQLAIFHKGDVYRDFPCLCFVRANSLRIQGSTPIEMNDAGVIQTAIVWSSGADSHSVDLQERG